MFRLLSKRIRPTVPYANRHIDAIDMRQERLHDAAIALNRMISRNGIKSGIFGGYAMGILGGPRESKDVDCLASVTKQQIISLLDGKEGFQCIPQGREDYVAFF